MFEKHVEKHFEKYRSLATEITVCNFSLDIY